MSLKPVFDRYTEWKRDLLARCEPLLVQMRQELCALQKRPDADDEIASAEELVRAKLEPILLEAERSLRAVQQAAEHYFEQTEEPSDQDQADNDEIGSGVDRVRDRLDRRLTSLVAQARAQELSLQPPAQA